MTNEGSVEAVNTGYVLVINRNNALVGASYLTAPLRKPSFTAEERQNHWQYPSWDEEADKAVVFDSFRDVLNQIQWIAWFGGGYGDRLEILKRVKTTRVYSTVEFTPVE